MLKLDEKKFDDSIGCLKKTFNDDILNLVVGAVQGVMSLGDDNPLMEQFVEAGKNMQETYNSCLDGVDKFIAETQGVYDIAEFLKKKDLGSVSKVDASFDVDTIDTSAVII